MIVNVVDMISIVGYNPECGNGFRNVSDFGMVFGIGCIGCHVKPRGPHLDLCIAEVAEMSGAPCVKLHVG